MNVVKYVLIVALVTLCSKTASGQSAITVKDTLNPNEFSCKYHYPSPGADGGYFWTQFSIPEAGSVTITILDTLNNIVYQFPTGEYAAGTYQVDWAAERTDGSKVPSGFYLFRLEAGHGRGWEGRYQQRFILLR
jgi:flagellar hook assembly protein FlgD